MLLTLMMLWVMNFRETWNPHDLIGTTQGSYVQVVHSAYDDKANQTYFVLARYDIEPEGQEYVNFLQPRPLVGQPTHKQMIDSVEVDPQITKINN